MASHKRRFKALLKEAVPDASFDCGKCGKTVKTPPGEMPGHSTMVGSTFFHLGCWWYMTDAERQDAFVKFDTTN